MDTKILIMRPDEPHETRNVTLPPLGDANFLKALHALLDPILGTSDVEHVTVFADFSGGTDYAYTDMFVDECGQLKSLPINGVATDIYRRNWLLHEKDPGPPDDLPTIAGPAVLFRDPFWRQI